MSSAAVSGNSQRWVRFLNHLSFRWTLPLILGFSERICFNLYLYSLTRAIELCTVRTFVAVAQWNRTYFCQVRIRSAVIYVHFWRAFFSFFSANSVFVCERDHLDSLTYSWKLTLLDRLVSDWSSQHLNKRRLFPLPHFFQKIPKFHKIKF